jgi:hypothetical protein
VSIVLESSDHALQVKCGYLFTKLTTFRSLSERLKKVTRVKLDLSLSWLDFLSPKCK